MKDIQTQVAGSDAVISGATVNGVHKLKTQYGSSHFGSGGASGFVRCSSNCRTMGVNDNGFAAGPNQVVVIDSTKPARFYARGSDCIGEGRVWGEGGEYTPGTGWVPVPGVWQKGKAERVAWVDDEYILWGPEIVSRKDQPPRSPPGPVAPQGRWGADGHGGRGPKSF